MTISEQFGDKVLKYRKSAKLTQEDLAEQANISVRQLSDIENGKANPKLDTVVRLCIICDIDIREISLS